MKIQYFDGYFIEMDPVQVVLQFLKEEGYKESFEALKREAEVEYKENDLRPHVLRQNLGEMNITDQTSALRRILNGPKITSAVEESKTSFNGSPVAMLTIHENNEKYVLTSFTDGSVKKIDAAGKEIASVNHKISTLLCFEQQNNLVYFGTMSGSIGSLKLSDLSIHNQTNLPPGSIVGITIVGKYLFAASRGNHFIILNTDDLDSPVAIFTYPNPVTALCKVKDGVIYSVQNDSMFHFRKSDDVLNEVLFHMNPNSFDIGAMDIRYLEPCPADESIFVALTDRCSAYLYRYPKDSKQLEVMKVLTHFVSDGLTQPQLLWTFGPTLISTSDDQTVIGVEIESNMVSFKLTGWKKATRCVAIINKKLLVGAFDKSITVFNIELV